MGKRLRRPVPSRAATQYDAFISYSHAADGKLAPALQAGLQRLAKPWYRPRAVRVFRDDTGLAVNPRLWPSITTAMEGSRYFILLCSPDAAASPWVNREIDHWVAHHPAEHILPVLTDGTLEWDPARGAYDPDRSTALPPSLVGRFDDEPRHLDLRWARDEEQLDLRHSRFREAIADLAAPLHGIPKDELEGEDIRQHRRGRRLARGAVGALALLMVVSLVAAGLAVVNSRQADRNATRAEAEATVADATRLAAQATSLAGSRLDLALDLAVEGYRLHPTVETEGALWTVLGATPPGLERLVHFDPPGGFAGVSNDGRLAAAPREDGVVRLIDTRSGHEVRSLVGHHSRARFATFTADDRHVAAGADDGRVIVWDAASGRRTGPSLDAGAGPAYGVFDPTDGTRLYTASYDGVVVAWDLTDRARPRSVELFRLPPYARPPPGNPVLVVPSGDGGRLLVGFLPDHSSHVWDVRRGALLAVVPGAPGAWSRDGSTVAIGRGREVVLVDAATGAQQGEALGGFSNSTPIMAFSPDGQRLAAADLDGTVRVFDLATRREARRLVHDSWALPQFLPDGRLVSRSSRLAAIVRLDAPAIAPMGRELGGHAASTVTGRFTADGSGIVTGDDNGRARRWDAETGAGRGAPSEAGTGVRARPSPDGRTVLFDAGHGPLGLYDATTERLRAALPADGDGRSSGGSSWSGDGRLLAHARGDSVQATLWDLADPDHPRQVARLLPDGPPDTPVGWTEFSADGRRIAVARFQTDTVTVFDTATGRRVSVLRTPTALWGQLAFSPDGRTLALTTIGNAWSVDFLDVATGQRRGRLPVPPLTLSLAYGRGGTRVATISTTRVATPSDPGSSSLRLWDTASLEPVGNALSLPGTNLNAESRIVAAPDGERFVQGGTDSAVVWDLEPPRWERLACRIANRSLSRAEWDRYLPGRAYDPAC